MSEISNNEVNSKINIVNFDNLENLLTNNFNQPSTIKLITLKDLEKGFVQENNNSNTEKINRNNNTIYYLHYFANSIICLMDIWKKYGSICLVIYSFLMCWFVFRL